MYQNGGSGCGGPVPQIMRKNDGNWGHKEKWKLLTKMGRWVESEVVQVMSHRSHWQLVGLAVSSRAILVFNFLWANWVKIGSHLKIRLDLNMMAQCVDGNSKILQHENWTSLSFNRIFILWYLEESKCLGNWEKLLFHVLCHPKEDFFSIFHFTSRHTSLEMIAKVETRVTFFWPIGIY